MSPGPREGGAAFLRHAGPARLPWKCADGRAGRPGAGPAESPGPTLGPVLLRRGRGEMAWRLRPQARPPASIGGVTPAAAGTLHALDTVAGADEEDPDAPPGEAFVGPLPAGDGPWVVGGVGPEGPWSRTVDLDPAIPADYRPMPAVTAPEIDLPTGHRIVEAAFSAHGMVLRWSRGPTKRFLDFVDAAAGGRPVPLEGWDGEGGGGWPRGGSRRAPPRWSWSRGSCTSAASESAPRMDRAVSP